MPLFPSRGYPAALASLPRSEDLDTAAGLIDAAGRPVIIAGNGVRVGRATDALMALAERIDAPVVTTSSGKGVIVETHVLAGGVMGDFGIEAANRIVAGADLILTYFAMDIARQGF